MLIEIYFNQVQNLIESCKNVEFFNLDYEKRGLYEGFIRGKIKYKDDSLLHLREFVYVEITVDRKMYSYQYMNAQNNLIFRYDNTEHHRKLNLPNFPHHKHDGSEDNVVNSNAPFLADVLKEIESYS
ncbi:MAG: toxin-antitoxin system TumE family protein [Waterburya sp.]